MAVPESKPPDAPNTNDLVDLGWDLSFLMQLRANDKISGESSDGTEYPLEVLSELLEGLGRFGLGKTNVPRLSGIVKELKGKYERDKIAVLSDYNLLRIHEAIMSLRGALRVELPSRKFVEIGRTDGLLDYGKLVVSGVASMFADPKVAELVPASVSDDLTDSLYCLAFSLPTPAAMLALRATEGMVRHAFALFVRKPREEPWGNIAVKLQRYFVSHNIESQELSGYFAHLRRIRNSAERPEKRFNMREGEDALLNAQYAVSALATLCEARSAAKPRK